MKLIFKKKSFCQLRIFLAITASIMIIIADSRLGLFFNIRSYMDTAISPLYYLVNGANQLLDHIYQIIITRSKLERENVNLKQKLILKNSEQLLLGQYKEENVHLRKLLGSPLRQDEQKMVTKVISSSTNPYSDHIMIDKGLDNGVYIGQTVISDRGVVGQVISSSKLTSRVLLICDSSHALPIQILRNNMRLIVSGNGANKDLQLEQLPGSKNDIRIGDILVTSGLGGRFPEGYPVAVVSSITMDTQRAYTIIQARPTAALQNIRYLLLLWDSNLHRENARQEEVHRIANERMMSSISSLSNTYSMFSKKNGQ